MTATILVVLAARGPDTETDAAFLAAMFAVLLLGLAGPPRATLGPAMGIALIALLIPLRGNGIVQPEGSCDPFCGTDGGSLLASFGPVALLLVPLLVAPALTGAALRHGWIFLRRRRGADRVAASQQ